MRLETTAAEQTFESPLEETSSSAAISKEKLLDYFNAAVSLGIVFYGFAGFWGPYRWVAEIQIAVFGVYLIKLTGVIAFAMVYATLMVVEGGAKHILSRRHL